MIIRMLINVLLFTIIHCLLNHNIICILIVMKIKCLSIWHCEIRNLTLYVAELLGNIFVRHLLHVIRRIAFKSISLDVVDNVLLSDLAHEVISATNATVVNNGVVVILGEDIIAWKLCRILIGLTL